MAIAPTSVLYYPTIDIHDGMWLRSAVLFWESVRTIVPEGFGTPYRSRLARELQDEGALRPIIVNPDMPEIEALSFDVEDFLTDPSSAGVIFGGQGNSDRIHIDKLPRLVRDFVQVDTNKFPRPLRQLLDFPGRSGFISVERGFAAFYMTLLARQLSERRGLGLVTGSGEADELSLALRKGKLIRSSDITFGGHRPPRHYELTAGHRQLPRGVATGVMVDLLFEGIKVPSRVTGKQLVRFREEHSDELAILRNEIATLLADVPDGIPLEAVREAVRNQYRSHVQPALARVRSSMAGRGWETATSGFLKTTFMAVPATSALALLHMPTPMALLVGGGLSLTATTIKILNERRDALNECPYSYLLSLRRQGW